MRDKALDDLIREEVAPEFVEDVLALVRPCVRVRALAPDASAQSVGRSRIGGRPDLPEQEEWPRVGDHTLLFVGQIDLREAAEFDLERRLPPAGLLAFFYDWSVTTGCVRYFSTDLALRTCAPPSEARPAINPSWFGRLFYGERPVATFRACPVKLVREMIPPDGMSFAMDALSKGFVYSEEFYEKYHVLMGEKETDPHHQLLGNTMSIQGAYMEAECAGISLGKASPTNEQLAELSQWLLLAQFDSDDLPGMMWGDLGRLYYYIRASDLANADFSRVYVTGQCY